VITGKKNLAEWTQSVSDHIERAVYFDGKQQLWFISLSLPPVSD